MHIPSGAPMRLPHTRLVLLIAGLVLLGTACSTPVPSPSPGPSMTPAATPRPSPTPQPTPRYTNSPDAALAALIPTSVLGNPVVIPAVTDFGLAPGDIGQVYGDLGLRFRSLQVAFVERPRLSLYAVRMDPPNATMTELEPYLATAGQYVGIAGLHLAPWTLRAIGGRYVWVRPGDGAAVKGTMLYTWTADGYLFLMIGVNEEQNLAMFAALPAAPAPTPIPSPSEPAGASPAASVGASPG